MNSDINPVEFLAPIYMICWCLVMSVIIGIRGFKHPYQYAIMFGMIIIMIFFSWMIPLEILRGTDIQFFENPPMADPTLYVNLGPGGWVILAINPIGWMAPLLGFVIVRRCDEGFLTHEDDSILEETYV